MRCIDTDGSELLYRNKTYNNKEMRSADFVWVTLIFGGKKIKGLRAKGSSLSLSPSPLPLLSLSLALSLSPFRSPLFFLCPVQLFAYLLGLRLAQTPRLPLLRFFPLVNFCCILRNLQF